MVSEKLRRGSEDLDRAIGSYAGSRDHTSCNAKFEEPRRVSSEGSPSILSGARGWMHQNYSSFLSVIGFGGAAVAAVYLATVYLGNPSDMQAQAPQRPKEKTEKPAESENKVEYSPLETITGELRDVYSSIKSGNREGALAEIDKLIKTYEDGGLDASGLYVLRGLVAKRDLRPAYAAALAEELARCEADADGIDQGLAELQGPAPAEEAKPQAAEPTPKKPRKRRGSR